MSSEHPRPPKVPLYPPELDGDDELLEPPPDPFLDGIVEKALDLVRDRLAPDELEAARLALYAVLETHPTYVELVERARAQSQGAPVVDKSSDVTKRGLEEVAKTVVGKLGSGGDL